MKNMDLMHLHHELGFYGYGEKKQRRYLHDYTLVSNYLDISL